jgi:hypothetical protein
MATTIRYKTFPWTGRRQSNERLEQRARALVEAQNWWRDGLPGRFGQRLLRRAGDGHTAMLVVGCSPYGDSARLVLWGGPWVPPGYRVRRPHGATGALVEPDPANLVTPSGDAFLVSPHAAFADASSPLGEALSHTHAESLGPDEIAWRAINVPTSPLDEGLRVIADHADACLRDAEAWAAATRLFLRSRHYR